ncbi:uncharacterized protein EI90DRAFT_2902511, partial [Cantharellus anzutake]|uniref:uncharacterized protein n=1 Tax=Cantharellus anzutake TaxID=1750568 RepID=UPI001906DEE6
IFIVWIGPCCRVMRKAKVSIQTADVKKAISQYSVDVVTEKNDQPIVVWRRSVAPVAPHCLPFLNYQL